MPTERITFRVSPEAAQAYRSASREDRAQIHAMLELRLLSRRNAALALENLLDAIQEQATRTDMTEQALQEILNEG